MKKLEDLTNIEYAVLKSAGILWEIYPQATGDYQDDCSKSVKDDILKVEQNDLEK